MRAVVEAAWRRLRRTQVAIESVGGPLRIEADAQRHSTKPARPLAGQAARRRFYDRFKIWPQPRALLLQKADGNPPAHDPLRQESVAPLGPVTVSVLEIVIPLPFIARSVSDGPGFRRSAGTPR